MERKEIVAQYRKGVGTCRLAEMIGVHRTTVQRWLQQEGIELRKRSPQQFYDVKFFSEFNPVSCYWAGFILADGCVRSDRATVSLHLARRDSVHLKKFARLIGLGTDRVHPDGERACRVDVNGKWFPEDLRWNFGIVPRKSLIARFPKEVPQEYWNHLVRGLFDGDGSVGRMAGKITASGLSFTGTKALLNTLREIFYDEVGVRLKSRNRVPPVCMTSKAGILCYSGANADLVLRWMYENSTVSTRLTRKFRRWNDVRRK